MRDFQLLPFIKGNNQSQFTVVSMSQFTSLQLTPKEISHNLTENLIILEEETQQERHWKNVLPESNMESKPLLLLVDVELLQP
jgi:hypothetical protein